jgi:hypothetical protein
MAHVTAPLPPSRDLLPDLSPSVEQVLLRALAKRPGDRSPSGLTLCAALAEAAGLPFTTALAAFGDGPSAPARSYLADDEHDISHRPSRVRPRWHRNVALVGLAVGVLVVALPLTHETEVAIPAPHPEGRALRCAGRASRRAEGVRRGEAAVHGADLAPVVEVVGQAEHHEELAARAAAIQGRVLGPGVARPQHPFIVEHPAQVGQGDGRVE